MKSEIAKHRTLGAEDQGPLLLDAMALREEFVRADAVVADIMGHESEVEITFGLCPNAQLKRLKKACAESVKLPTL